MSTLLKCTAVQATDVVPYPSVLRVGRYMYEADHATIPPRKHALELQFCTRETNQPAVFLRGGSEEDEEDSVEAAPILAIDCHSDFTNDHWNIIGGLLFSSLEDVQKLESVIVEYVDPTTAPTIIAASQLYRTVSYTVNMERSDQYVESTLEIFGRAVFDTTTTPVEKVHLVIPWHDAWIYSADVARIVCAFSNKDNDTVAITPHDDDDTVRHDWPSVSVVRGHFKRRYWLSEGKVRHVCSQPSAPCWDIAGRMHEMCMSIPKALYDAAAEVKLSFADTIPECLQRVPRWCDFDLCDARAVVEPACDDDVTQCVIIPEDALCPSGQTRIVYGV